VFVALLLGLPAVGAIGASNASQASAAGLPARFSGGCQSTQTSGNLDASKLGSFNQLLLQAPARLQATVDPYWSSGCAMRIEVHEGDMDSSPTDRAEVAGNRVQWSSGQEVWYAMSFMLDPASALPSTGQWMLVDQFFAQDMTTRASGGSPPLAFEITPTKQARVYIRGGAKTSAAARAPRENSYFLAPASPGSWHELLVHAKWSTEADGRVEVWQRTPNGEFTSSPQVSASGPDILTVAGDVLPVYAETGIYRSRSAATQVVYYGGLWARPARAEAESFFPSHSPQASPPEVTSTALSCAPRALTIGQSASCTASVTNQSAIAAIAPGGRVNFSSSDSFSVFSDEGSCLLAPTIQSPPSSSCTVTYTPDLPLGQTLGSDLIGASYVPAAGTDTDSSDSNTEVSVSAGASVQTNGPAAPPAAADHPASGGSSGDDARQAPLTTPGRLGPTQSSVAATKGAAMVARLITAGSVAEDAAAVARAVTAAAGASRRGSPSGHSACNRVTAMVPLDPGHYDDSLRISRTLQHGSGGGSNFTRGAIATGQMTVGAPGTYRFRLRLTQAGCRLWLDARRNGLAVHLSNVLVYKPDRSQSVRSTAQVYLRF
jgi:hypothetical protein